MNKDNKIRIAGATLAVAAMTMVSSCSLLQSNSMPYFSGEGKCPVCGTVISKHPVAQQQQDSTVDKTLLHELLSKDYSIVDYGFEEPKRMEWKDDTITETQDNLVPYFKPVKVEGRNSLIPVKATIANDENDVFLYFTQDEQGTPQELRLRVQYYADDPLNYVKMVFTIDGFDYEFTPTNLKRGKGTGIMIWESSDDALTAGDKDLAYALSHCQYWSRCKLTSADGMTHVKIMSKEQLEAMKRTVQLYLLRGGSFK